MDILQQQGFEVPGYLCAKDGKSRQVEMSLKKESVENLEELEGSVKSPEDEDDDDDCVPSYDGSLKDFNPDAVDEDGQLGNLDESGQVSTQEALRLSRLDRLDEKEKLNRSENLDATLNSYETKEDLQQGEGIVCPLCGYNPNTPAKLREHMAYKHFTENIKASFMKDERRCLVDDCTKEFTNMSSLVRHIGSTHNKVRKLFHENCFLL